MNHPLKILSKTANGVISKNTNTNMFQIVFNNLQFTFTLTGYDMFTNYIVQLNKEFELHQKDSHCTCSEIVIPTANETLQLLLKAHELRELCDLLSIRNLDRDIRSQLNFTFSLN
ncbi:DUF6686 family protein [Flavicella sediminum]|uniref:DUF6686 family protein n=1 Tax=Flavicella sediminum TaxID=2585141 RepID=UPI0011201F18|nr:DUF6686 family protein [Flavicella sediminum]